MSKKYPIFKLYIHHDGYIIYIYGTVSRQNATNTTFQGWPKLVGLSSYLEKGKAHSRVNFVLHRVHLFLIQTLRKVGLFLKQNVTKEVDLFRQTATYPLFFSYKFISCFLSSFSLFHTSSKFIFIYHDLFLFYYYTACKPLWISLMINVLPNRSYYLLLLSIVPYCQQSHSFILTKSTRASHKGI